MSLEQYNKVYFVGIGGIGMSALARYFKASGKDVAGYDKTASEITTLLMQSGIDISFSDSSNNIPERFKNTEDTLVVYTPAIPIDNQQLAFFKTENFQLQKRAQVLGAITKDSFCFAVAGTHGKTTTTSILAHLLNECNVAFSAFLGGISENFNSNIVLKGMDVTVVEADEFDRSFLTLSPDFACVTSMDADHLDIYGNDQELKKTFIYFTKCIKDGGKLFVKNGLDLSGITYGIEDDSDYSAQNIRIENGSYLFDFQTPSQLLKDIKFDLPGRHNLSNAIIAMAMTVEYGLPQPQLAKALALYKGVKRRFTVHLKSSDLVYIDDYAHHPEEINAVYQAISEMFPNKNTLAVFQPHLFSRTRDFIDDFASSLSRFDSVILLDIYPARELPINGVNSNWLLEKITSTNKMISSKEALIPNILSQKTNVVISMGAGDIGEQVVKIKKALLDETTA